MSAHWYEPEPSDPIWLAVANAEVGTREVEGEGDNPRVLEYHAATRLQATDDEVPWCSAFVNWVLAQAGIEGTRSAAARSWLDWGTPLVTPRRGCLVAFSRPPGRASGHVAFWLGETQARVLCLGGNQRDAVSVWQYPRERILGYRWPEGVA